MYHYPIHGCVELYFTTLLFSGSVFNLIMGQGCVYCLVRFGYKNHLGLGKDEEKNDLVPLRLDIFPGSL